MNLPLPLPLPVERAIKKLGADLSLARRRRNMTQAMLAERLGTSVMTVRRMEDGHRGTALQYLARALQVFGELNKKGGQLPVFFRPGSHPPCKTLNCKTPFFLGDDKK